MAVNNTLIGALRVEASLDSGKFVDGAKKIRTEAKQTEASIKSSFSGIGNSLKAGIAGFVGALSVGLFTQAIQAGLKYASSLGDISQQLGVTTRDLQGFRYAAGQLGVSQQQLETGLQHLTETLGKVAAGAQKPAKALAAIGITARELANVDTGTAFRMIADGLSKVDDRAQRAAIELALFGESGSKLDSMLAGGSDRINELSDAAARLGIILSDEQIRKADETADKLDALKTVLGASIAGVVADNADSIYKLADSIANLVAQIPGAIQQLKSFYATFLNFSANVTEGFDRAVMHPLNRFNPLAAPFRSEQMHANRLSSIQGERAEAGNIRRSAFGARIASTIKGTAARSTGSIDQFLAPKGRSGGRKRTSKAPRDRSEDVAYQFEREQMQADMAILRAKQQLAGTSEQRALLALQIIDLEHATQTAEINDRVRRAVRDNAEGKITDAALKEVEVQADVLRARNDQKTALEKQAFIEERLADAEQANFEAADRQRQWQIDALELADRMATTQADHRRIQLEILDSRINQRRLELEHEKQLAIRNGATAEEIRVIQDQIDHLSAERAQGAAGVILNTESPLEQWARSIPQTAAEVNEALQSIEAQGLDSLSDAIADVITGTKSMAEAFGDVANQIIADIIRMTVRMLIFQAISGIFGGGSSSGINVTPGAGVSPTSFTPPGFASGGSFRLFGPRGVDQIPLSAGGIHIADVSHGEKVSISNGGGSGGVGRVVVELRDNMLDARIAEGANVQIVRAYPTMKADTMRSMQDRGRRR